MKENIEAHKKGIFLESFPTTFKDAIKVIRNLGLRYIWIDSLCIIQDDTDDWMRESEHMGRVYGSAELVLAATVASSADDGFLKNRPRMKSGRVHINLGNKNDPLNMEEVNPDGESDNNNGSELVQCNYRIASKHAHEAKLPLDKRAWAHQERLLATRYISFRHDEIRFDCLEGSDCECGWMHAKNHYRNYTMNLGNKLKQDSKMGGAEVWSDIVKDYCRRELTERSDKPVALSAVASRFHTKFGDTYLAGLWRKNLIRGLLWRVNPFGITHPPIPSKPEPFYAPSWSWISVDAKDIYLPDTYPLDDSALVQISCAFTTPATSNQFGPVSEGHIRLQGKLVQFTLHISTSTPSRFFFLFNQKNIRRWIQFSDDTLKLRSLHLDLPLTAGVQTQDHTTGNATISARRIIHDKKDSIQEVFADYTAWALPLMANDYGTYLLVLGLSPERPGCYQRLGYGELYNPVNSRSEMKNYISNKFESREITIV
ncbi:heterokaryon incompatibility protein-domain-containing protein [Rostrohypoxylon terebratum]|nr:heterokaryon incompatibility protein-domain-containing protein [Rostrohypoxylon terebratum]